MNRKGFVIVALVCLGLLGLASVASAAVDKVICVPWQGDINKQHTAISGQAAQLKGVIKTTDTTAVYYKWVFGDGTPDSGVTTLSGATKYNVATTHTYTAATGTPFTAFLQVSNTSPFALSKQDTYLLMIENNEINAQINIAIDKGLWWLYINPYSNANNATYNGQPFMVWLQTSYVWVEASPTASAIHAFAINNHKYYGNPDQDPYVEAVRLGMNWLTNGRYGSSPMLNAVTIGPPSGHTSDNPDANGNGLGIQVYDASNGDRTPYQGGQIMDAIIASGVLPTDSTGRDFAPGTPKSHNWTYGELLQDMADMHAWGQWDGSGCNGGICGSWWYNWNYSSPGDNSASQWPTIGMIPAQQPPWNVIVPQWVKNYNANWLAYSMGCTGPSSAVTACTYNFFSYNGVGGYAGDLGLQTTSSGMVQMIFDGQTTADLKWGRGHKYIADRWQNFTHQSSSWGSAKTYGWFSFAKAMRLSLPNPTTHLTKTAGASFDWYYGNPNNATCTNEANCEQGLAARILEIQAADGSWQISNLTNPPMTTAWMIITLRPTLFAAAPIACFNAVPNPSYPNQDIFFNPSCSGHSESGKTIENLTKFEWDWNNDGTFDVSSSLPAVQTHQFACAVLPCTYPVTLRVTDDNIPPLTATTIVNINITNPPHPPVADAGGPYMVSLCGNDSLKLDGSNSFDQDEGQHEAGCSTCPNDTITSWGWDLTPPPTGFNDVSGATPIVNPGAFFTAGTYDIGLRVTDNTALAYPGSQQPNLTNSDFAQVNVQTGCICNLVARPKLTKIQLTWTHTGAPSYDIYRSTLGPNTGFVKIKSNLVTTYATYLDKGVVVGTKYYYRVISNSAAAPCGSNAASATPVTR